MKINIKNNFGSIISSKSTTIINGRKVSGKCKTQEFDERREENVDNIEKIVIVSALADINISASNSSKVEAHFYGNATIDKDINFEVKKIKSQIRIAVEYSGTCCNSNLKIDIKVPIESMLKIYAESMSSNITVDKLIAEYFKVETVSGNVEINAKLKDITVDTVSGNVDINIKANSDIKMKIETVSGNINLGLDNLEKIKLSSDSFNGYVGSHNTDNTNYIANIKISTISGIINFH